MIRDHSELNLSMDIDQLHRVASFPASPFLTNTEWAKHFSSAYWRNQIDQNPELELLNLHNDKTYRPITAYEPTVVRDMLQTIATWRVEARDKVARMSQTERNAILHGLGIPGYEDQRTTKAQPKDDLSSSLSSSSTCESSKRGEVSHKSNKKRKALLYNRASYRAKKYRRSVLSNRTDRKQGGSKPIGRPPSKITHHRGTAASSSRDSKRVADLDASFEDEEDEEEDQLTRIVERQRKEFSARAAAGRPSARHSSRHSTLGQKLSGANLSLINRATQANPVLREWRALSRKILSKVGRQWMTNRRDKLVLAKRAARECAKILRQRAVSSQKSNKDTISRTHKIARELSTHWRNCLSSASSGTGPLVINGVPLPSDKETLTYVERYGNGKSDGLQSGSGGDTGSGTGGGESAAVVRRRAERAAAEQRRADMELLEARRQQRKLNFLITQTELYAHFMGRKLDYTPDVKSSLEERQKSSSKLAEEEATQRILNKFSESDEEHESKKRLKSEAETDMESEVKTGPVSIAMAAKEAADRLGVPMDDAYDVEQLRSAAVSRALSAVEREQSRQMTFPQCVSSSSTNRSMRTQQEFNTDTVEAPRVFKGHLKAYQLRGLNWLLSLFDQGINGILADEMGLGKTIQTIAFLGHLAERYNIWGPFLIVAPSSTLHNWTQEFEKFLPSFRIVPYWGSPNERKVLRRFWSTPRSQPNLVTGELDENGTNSSSRGLPGMKDAEMHVVVTSYQIILQDAKFINKTPWSYIVLDEAHAIKSCSSLRWRILLSLKCRNRLLLTGTPIQNTMQELWALLHFIMPTLFDSHDEFANWFSRDIESQVTGSGGAMTSSLVTSKLNANQLSRLHLILKPFMLRRTKTEVEHEISTKTEISRYCSLTTRQQVFYNRLRNKICLEDLNSILTGGESGMGDGAFALATNNTNTTAHLITLVMQLRKVCNHPDLWEPRDALFPCLLGGAQIASEEPVQLSPPVLDGKPNRARFWNLPKLFYDEGLIPQLSWNNHYPRTLLTGTNLPNCLINHCTILDACKLTLVSCLFALFHPSHIHNDIWPQNRDDETIHSKSDIHGFSSEIDCVHSCFSFVRLMGLSPNEFAWAVITNGTSVVTDERRQTRAECDQLSAVFNSNQDIEPSSSCHQRAVLISDLITKNLCIISCEDTVDLSLGYNLSYPIRYTPRYQCSSDWGLVQSGNLDMALTDANRSICLHFVPKVILTTTQLHVSVPLFSKRFERLHQAHPSSCPIIPFNPNFITVMDQLHNPQIQCRPMVDHLVPVHLATRISDSGKLTMLDALLNELKPAGHRVLVYSQMTRMIDILEEFMIYRKHTYLRLDGSSRLSDRRDMVAQWQSNPRWFVFLLSTRAGGLGINLTAADTVIFYDSDWNPTVDQQAMDRAHRLGQTKPVTVYRLVCENTIEERMMQRAEEKRAMQHMVIRSGEHARFGPPPSDRKNDQLTSADMVSLLLDDEELVKRLQIRRRQQTNQRGRAQKNVPQPNNPTVSAIFTSHTNLANATKDLESDQKTDNSVSSSEHAGLKRSTSKPDWHIPVKQCRLNQVDDSFV